MDTSILLAVLLCIVTFLGIAIFFLAASYQRLMAQNKMILSKDHREREVAHHKAGHILDEAREKSFEMMLETQEKAANILSETDYVRDTAKAEIEAKLKTATTEQATEYSQMLLAVRKETMALFEHLTQQIQTQTMQEIDEFRHTVQDHTEKLETALRTQVQQAYSQAGAGAETYKQELMAKAEHNLYPLVKQITYDTIGKTLSASEQEELVRHALEEAKEKGFFA